MSVNSYYADSDFLLALLKPSDWLKENAEEIFKKHEGKVFTSETAVVEILWFSRKEKIDPLSYITSLCSLVEIINSDPRLYVQAAYFMRNHEIDPCDSIHAAYGKINSMPIISSEREYEKIGVETIKLKTDV